VAKRGDVERAKEYTEADLILFDAKSLDPNALPGGNGLTFDWRLLSGVRGKMRFMLSGGLTPETVAEAIRLTKAAIVDVSSGVESAPGKKKAALIRRFVAAAQAPEYEPGIVM
jgi:phosphoribosylanthranilate isomerase